MDNSIINIETALISEALLYELHTLETSTIGYSETLQTVNRALNEARKLAEAVLPRATLKKIQLELHDAMRD